MRILVLSPVVPFPADDGGRIRVHELLGGLAADHDVELLALTDASAADRDGLASLRAEGLRVDAVKHRPDRRAVAVRSLLTGRSLNGSLVRSRALLDRLDERVAGGDVDSVQCEYSAMAAYRRSCARVPWVLDAHNVEFRISASLAAAAPGPRRAAYRAYAHREARRLRTEEVAAWRRMDHVVTVSDVDRRIVEELAPGTATTVVPNGVDVVRVRPPALDGRGADRRPAAVFVGKMDYRPNVDGARWFTEEILPLVRQRVPSFALTIVGRDPTPEVQALSGRDGVHVTGRVQSTTPFLHEASLAVVPLRAGSGSRLKVLEALAAGTPVVSTSLGVEGLQVDAGRHLLVADGAPAFAAAVADLLADPDRRARMAREGRRLVEERYGWREAVRTLASVHERAVDAHRARDRG
jgi:sugar transferase (PEP-CTERM/EpsH1 system associated)